MNTDAYIKSIVLNKNKIINWEAYPFSLPVVRHLDKLDLKSKVTFFVGENGSGKSTLIEAIAVSFGFNPEGGSKNFSFSTHPSHSDLYEYLTLVKSPQRIKDGFFLRAESYYNVSSEIDALEKENSGMLASYGGKSMHEQSHGESFLSLIMNRFWGNGLYVLDEPEAALSPMRQLSLLARMGELVKQNSQFIIATHSPILMAYPGAQIYVFDENGFHLTPYEQTEHYQLTKLFLNNPQRMLKELMD